MNFRKRFLAFSLGLFLLASNILPAFAASKFYDVAEDFRAYKEIDDVVTKGIIVPVEEGVFAPWGKVTRAEFAGMLLRALRKDKVDVVVSNRYSDVNVNTKGYTDILRSDQVGTTVGFPDGTFKPYDLITKIETETMLAHITNETGFLPELLLQFPDSKEIPGWATRPYAQCIKYNLYYNDPDPTKLTPMTTLHRYEAAVLLSRLSNSLFLVKDQFKAEEEPAVVAQEPVVEQPREYLLSAEHLNIYDQAAVNRVTITNYRMIVLAKNVFKVAFVEKFMSKHHNIGDTEVFYFKEDVRTVEGTLVFPKNTKLYAKVADIKENRALNKNEEVYFDFQRLEFPNGKSVPFIGRVLNERDGWLCENFWVKPLNYTLAGAAIGAGTGAGIGAATSGHNAGDGIAIGLPVGAGVGLATGFVTKGVNFKANKDEEVLVELKIDCNVYNE